MDIIVYTCITNGKDLLKDYATEEGIEYICFTDGTVDAVPGWQMRELAWTHEDPRRIARFHKLNPTAVLPTHKTSVWIDGSLIPRVRIKDLVEWVGDASYAIRPHPGWNCIYDEANAILRLGFDKYEIITTVIDRYQDEQFPKGFGMHETGILVRKNIESVKEFDALWWHEVETGSKRDQMSFDYVRWKTDWKVKELDRAWFGQDQNMPFYGHKHDG